MGATDLARTGREDELAAGGVDGTTSRVPNRHVDSRATENVNEATDPCWRRSHHRVARGWVQGDEVHMCPEPLGYRDEESGLFFGVVDPVDHGPLDGGATMRGAVPIGDGLFKRGERVAVVRRDQLRTQFIVRRMK